MIVDTDVLIWYLKGNENALEAIEELNKFSISVVTYIELVQGMRNKKELNSDRPKTPVQPLFTRLACPGILGKQRRRMS